MYVFSVGMLNNERISHKAAESCCHVTAVHRNRLLEFTTSYPGSAPALNEQAGEQRNTPGVRKNAEKWGSA